MTSAAGLCYAGLKLRTRGRSTCREEGIHLIYGLRRPIGRLDRGLSALGGALILALGLGVLPGCEREEPQVSAVSQTTRSPDQRIQDFVLTETEGGRKMWVLQAERAKIFDSSNEINLDTLVVDFFGSSQEHSSRLTSNHGVINRTTRNMEAFGDVLIVTDDGLRLETEEVEWLNKRSQIVSEAPVRFTRGRNVLTGVGFVSSPSLEDMEILSEIQADVHDPEGSGKEEGSEI